MGRGPILLIFFGDIKSECENNMINNKFSMVLQQAETDRLQTVVYTKSGVNFRGRVTGVNDQLLHMNATVLAVGDPLATCIDMDEIVAVSVKVM